MLSGCAGFIGSHLLEALLVTQQSVVGLDNLDTGTAANLEDVRTRVGNDLWKKFTFVKADINDSNAYFHLMDGCDFVLHQAARGSVQRSLEDPLGTNAANVSGFLTLIACAAKALVKGFIYASSSSVYGDDQELPKKEERIGSPLSPYAVTKLTGERYAFVYSRLFSLNTIGFRYFNVFGPRQSIRGPYAAVIPTWIDALRAGRQCTIFGDGETSRDFCYVENVVQANLLAALYLEKVSGECHVLNVGGGRTTSLKTLHELIGQFTKAHIKQKPSQPKFSDFRPGDIAHSLADVTKIQKLLGYRPSVSIEEGLKRTIEWNFSR